MALRLGTAPDSWGVWFPSDPRQIPWSRFLDEVVEARYDAIELGPIGYLPTDPKILKTELSRRGLRLSGAFVGGALEKADSWEALRATVDQTCRLIAGFEADYLGIIDGQYTDPITGEVIGQAELDSTAWQQLIKTVHRIGRAAKQYGIGAVFHPHADTAVEYERQIERFLADTDPELINLQFDVGHHAYRGGDPVSFLRRHHRRISCLHLKSVDGEVRQQVLSRRVPWSEAVAMGIFIEPELGVVDFVALKEVIDEIEFDGWGIVEQDMYPAPFDKPLPIAKRTQEYLAAVGFGQPQLISDSESASTKLEGTD